MWTGSNVTFVMLAPPEYRGECSSLSRITAEELCENETENPQLNG